MNGIDALVPYAIYAGCKGLIWGGANIAPKTCLAMVNAAEAGRWGEARRIWNELEPLMSLLWEGDYVQSVYAAAEISGFGAGRPRKPLRDLASEKLDRLRTAMGNLPRLEAAS